MVSKCRLSSFRADPLGPFSHFCEFGRQCAQPGPASLEETRVSHCNTGAVSLQRAKSTKICLDVFQIPFHLSQLSPGGQASPEFCIAEHRLQTRNFL